MSGLPSRVVSWISFKRFCPSNEIRPCSHSRKLSDASRYFLSEAMPSPSMLFCGSSNDTKASRWLYECRLENAGRSKYTDRLYVLGDKTVTAEPSALRV